MRPSTRNFIRPSTKKWFKNNLAALIVPVASGIALFLAGALLPPESGFLGGLGAFLRTTGIVLSTSLLSLWYNKFVADPTKRVEVLIGHDVIYRRYRKELKDAVAETQGHTIACTVASVPSLADVVRGWDDEVCNQIRQDRLIYKRVVVKPTKNPSIWDERLCHIWRTYLNSKDYAQRDLKNYHHYETQGPPSIECLLIGDDRVFLTFGSSAQRPQESWGLFVTDHTICRELGNYFNRLVKDHCTEGLPKPDRC